MLSFLPSLLELVMVRCNDIPDHLYPGEALLGIELGESPDELCGHSVPNVAISPKSLGLVQQMGMMEGCDCLVQQRWCTLGSASIQYQAQAHPQEQPCRRSMKWQQCFLPTHLLSASHGNTHRFNVSAESPECAEHHVSDEERRDSVALFLEVAAGLPRLWAGEGRELKLQPRKHVDKLIEEVGVEHDLAVHDGSTVGKLPVESALMRHDVPAGRQKLESLYQDTILLTSHEETGILSADMEQDGF
jgi:hypothetical protein